MSFPHKEVDFNFPVKTTFCSFSLPPSHSYTHRTRSASPDRHDRSRVILTPKKNFFLVLSGN